MGYYMRFFDTSEEPLSLDTIDGALRQIDPAFRIDVLPDTNEMQGELHYDTELYGEIEINQGGEELFEAERKEQLESLEEAEEGDVELVGETLRSARRSVVVRVLWQGREAEATLVRLDPIWSWLLGKRNGLMQADGEGFYNHEGLVLSVP